MRAAPALLAGLAALSLALTGCGVAATSTPPSAAPMSEAAGESLPAPRPIAMSIPSIDVSSSLIETGLLPDGTPEVPPVTTPGQASWWSGSPTPGSVGPATLLGHVDGEVNGVPGQPGVFQRLRELKPGDRVVVDRLAAAPVIFVVDRVEAFPKSAFDQVDGQPSAATLAVYGDVARPELRLITCGGDFDHDPRVRSYRDQIVAFAHQQGTS